MTALPGFVAKLLPPTPLSRRLATQSLLFATGEGTFLTGSAFYFYHFVGLTPAQVGLGLTIAGVASFLFAYPMGRLADVVGQQRMWALGALVGAVMIGLWPFIHGFGLYVAMVVAFEAVGHAGGAGRNAYVIDVLPQKERVETQAFMYSSINLGFTLGALIAGVALAVHSDVLLRWGVPGVAVVSGLLNAFWITRLPRAAHEERRTSGEAKVKPTGPGALRNRGWILASTFFGTLQTNQVLLNVVIPLWLVAETDSPRWLLAWLFGTNTVLCIILPAYTSKGVQTLADAMRRVWWSAGFFVVSCVITLFTHSTHGLLTIGLVWLAHVAVTGAELAVNSGSWALEIALMDPARRGEYQGVANAGGAVGGAWAPALFTFLAMSWQPSFFHGAGWLVIAAIVVVATLGLGPAVRMADAFRQQHFPEDAPSEPALAQDGV